MQVLPCGGACPVHSFKLNKLYELQLWARV